jgi:hypothetical protein
MIAYDVEIKIVRIIAQCSQKKETGNAKCLNDREALSKTPTCKLLHGGQQEEEELHKNRMAVREQTLLTFVVP